MAACGSGYESSTEATSTAADAALGLCGLCSKLGEGVKVEADDDLGDHCSLYMPSTSYGAAGEGALTEYGT